MSETTTMTEPDTPTTPQEPQTAAAPVVEVSIASKPAEAKPPEPVDTGPDVKSVLAELEEQKKKTAELEAAVSQERSARVNLAFTAAFDRAGVASEYREFLRSKIGDVDPTSEAGLKAIDDVARKHPAMLTVHVSTEDPMSAFLRSKADEARRNKQQSMWGLIPADMLRGYDVKGGE